MTKPSGHGAGRAQYKSGCRGLSPRPPGSTSEARGPGGQPKGHLRSAARCPAGLDGAAVRLDDALRDVEAETGAAAPTPTPELREDTALRLGRDAVALVGHRDLGAAVPRTNPDGDGATAVTKRVLDEVADHLRQLVGVDPHLRQLAVAHEHEAAGVLTGGDPRIEVATHDVDDVDHLFAQLEPARLDAGHVEQL